jgi:hypothetical protein
VEHILLLSALVVQQEQRLVAHKQEAEVNLRLLALSMPLVAGVGERTQAEAPCLMAEMVELAGEGHFQQQSLGNQLLVMVLLVVLVMATLAALVAVVLVLLVPHVVLVLVALVALVFLILCELVPLKLMVAVAVVRGHPAVVLAVVAAVQMVLQVQRIPV